MTEQELLLDCVRRLNRAGITYMLTGSMASSAWGIPRSTHDLDFVVQLTPSQIPSLVRAFANPDYFLDDAAVRAAYQPPYQFNLIHIPSALKTCPEVNVVLLDQPEKLLHFGDGIGDGIHPVNNHGCRKVGAPDR
jgi:hypothetical protein